MRRVDVFCAGVGVLLPRFNPRAAASHPDHSAAHPGPQLRGPKRVDPVVLDEELADQLVSQ